MRYFEDKRVAALALAPEAPQLIDSVRDLTLRGGKRLRPSLVVAAYRAVDPSRPVEAIIDACCSLELLQTYLLIHDDWMDHDEERRGGPAVHAALRSAHGGDVHLGASLAVLAGNLASAFAWELLTRGAHGNAVERRAITEFLRMHQEVVYGQQLDLLAVEDVSRMQRLKTGSYTVRGPLLLGAVLAEANDAQRAALLAYGRPLGEAFQMRDDLLGTFGDHRATGKPTGGDLREGKRTALVREAETLGTEEQLAPLRAVQGRPDATEVELAAAADALVAVGARAAVEARLVALLDEARQSLDATPLSESGVSLLRRLADLLTLRDR